MPPRKKSSKTIKTKNGWRRVEVGDTLLAGDEFGFVELEELQVPEGGLEGVVIPGGGGSSDDDAAPPGFEEVTRRFRSGEGEDPEGVGCADEGAGGEGPSGEAGGDAALLRAQLEALKKENASLRAAVAGEGTSSGKRKRKGAEEGDGEDSGAAAGGDADTADGGEASVDPSAPGSGKLARKKKKAELFKSLLERRAAEKAERLRRRTEREGVAGAPAEAGGSAPAGAAPPPSGPTAGGVSTARWEPFHLHPSLLGALSLLGFSSPTEIQAAVLPAAARDGRDVVGAAQTGSGKTLAFGLPMLDRLARDPSRAAWWRPLEGGDGAAAADDAGGAGAARHLRGLILAPTRELALQVAKHLDPLARAVGARVVPVVGGMSKDKQERLLGLRPEVVVATPGRLWELVGDGEPHLSDLSYLSDLAIDEADRMVQPGRYEELGEILRVIAEGTQKAEKRAQGLPDDAGVVFEGEGEEDEGENDSEGEVDREAGSGPSPSAEAPAPEASGANLSKLGKRKRCLGPRVMVFSATLTLPATLRKRLKKGGGGAHGSSDLEGLMDRLPFRATGRPLVADLSPQARVASRVHEAFVEVSDEGRDEALYLLLSVTSGRALVFVNAISSARRLVALLRALGLPARTLHAGQQQRARLASLDRFRTAADGVLVATDVAARGLDVPDVAVVVHYQLPASLDTYVHRSGRTGRGDAEGASVAFVTPGDVPRWRGILRALGKDSADVPPFPLDPVLLRGARARVKLAAKVEAIDRSASKSSADRAWERRAAEDAGIVLSGDESDPADERGTRGRGSAGRDAAEADRLRAELAELLSTPLQPSYSRKFFAGGAVAGAGAGDDSAEAVRVGLELAAARSQAEGGEVPRVATSKFAAAKAAAAKAPAAKATDGKGTSSKAAHPEAAAGKGAAGKGASAKVAGGRASSGKAAGAPSAGSGAPARSAGSASAGEAEGTRSKVGGGSGGAPKQASLAQSRATALQAAVQATLAKRAAKKAGKKKGQGGVPSTRITTSVAVPLARARSAPSALTQLRASLQKS